MDYPSRRPGADYGGVVAYDRGSWYDGDSVNGRFCYLTYVDSSTIRITAKVNCYIYSGNGGGFYYAGQYMDFQQSWYGRVDGICIISPA